MKLAFILFVMLAELAAIAAGPPLLDFCQPYNGSATEVIWKAPSNGLPATVRAFKVVPTRYAPDAISNLLQLAGLNEQNRERQTQAGVLQGKDVLTFGNVEGTRHLDIIPSEGTIAFTHIGVIVTAAKEAVTGVPGTNEALQKAFSFLPILGIAKSEVATNLPGKPIPYTLLEETEFRKNKAAGIFVTNVVGRGVTLYRQIDGIPVWGTAGVFALFGNEGRLANLAVTWRRIEPRGVCRVPTAGEFTARVRSGGALIRKAEAGASFKRLTIEKVDLYYWESDGSEHQTGIYPFTVLETVTDRAGEGAHLQLFVPLSFRVSR